MEKIRAANLRLLRHGVFNTGQITFSKTVGISQSKYSQLERSEVSLDSSLARQIEKDYKLPEGWMDRNNSDLFLNAAEYNLIKSIRDLSTSDQRAVIENFSGLINVIITKKPA